MLQAYKSNPLLGTPLDDESRVTSASAQQVYDSLAYKVFEKMNDLPADVSFSERDSLWWKSPAALEAPGFVREKLGTSGPIYGIDDYGGIVVHSRVCPELFADGEKYVEIGPTNEFNAIEPNARMGALRVPKRSDPTNTFTVAKEKRMVAAKAVEEQKFYGDLNAELDAATYGPNAPVPPPASETKPVVVVNTADITLPANASFVSTMPRQHAAVLEAQRAVPTVATTSFISAPVTTVPKPAALSQVSEKTNVSAVIWDNRGWVAIIVLAAILIVLLIILIVKAVEADKYRKKYFDVLMTR